MRSPSRLVRPLGSIARFLAGAALLGSFVTASGVLAPSSARADGALVGRPAPDLYVAQGYQGVAAGTTLSAYAGKVLVVKFFFTGCPACRASLPEFQSLYERYAGRDDVRFLGIAYDEASNVASLARQSGYTFPIAIDPDGVTAGRYYVQSFPTNVVIGADGVVVSEGPLSAFAIDRASAGSETARRAAADAARERNVRELGELPTVLEAAKAAAGANDYGAVLRVVEAHLDAAKDPADVVAAATRVQAVAYARFLARARRILAALRADPAAGWRMVDAFRTDFAGTSKEPSVAEWIVALGPRPAR